MKKIKILAGIIAASTAAMAMTAAVSAYSFNDKNLGKNWSLNAEVPASEFADITADSYITITFTADPDETEYWCIKPNVNDGGWIFVADAQYLADGEDVGAVISEGGDSFVIDSADVTSVTFKVPSGAVDLLKEGGMPIMGHSITLHELTISDEAHAAAAPAEDDTSADEDNTADETTSDDTSSEEASSNATGDTSAATSDKQNADTGVEGVAVVAGVALIAAAAVVISRKKK